MTDKEKRILRELIEAAAPFTSGNVVTETCGTIPLMERLEDALERARSVLRLA